MENLNISSGGEKQKEQIFTPELRKKLSDSFIKFLDSRKDTNLKTEKFSKEVIGIPEADLETERGLNIFKGALYDLIQSPDFPEGKTKTTLKIFLENLNTIDTRIAIDKLKQGNISEHEISKLDDPVSSPFSGLQSYGRAVDAILSALNEVLTPEVNLALKAYTEKIFIRPFDRAIDGLDNEI